MRNTINPEISGESLAVITIEKTSVSQKEPIGIKMVKKNNGEMYPEGLKWWDDEVFGMPNSLVRSGVFGICGDDRKVRINQLIDCPKNTRIIQTGIDLDQEDMEVAMKLIHVSKEKLFVSDHYGFEKRTMSFNAWLRLLGKKCTGGYQNRWLKNTLERLKTCNFQVQIFDKQEKLTKVVFTSILDDFGIDPETNKLAVMVNPQLAALFDRDTCRINKQERMRLRGGLAKWLHAFYSSHENPHRYPYSVTTIRDLCSSKNIDLASFRHDVKKALHEIENATGWECVINKDDAIEVYKN